jgi:transcriptional regulator with PAS, ATPase and Fis domain
VPVHVPPLRERRDDILPLARAFIRQFTPPAATPPTLGPDAVAALLAHAWAGNVRELRNVIERAMAYAPLPAVLGVGHLRLGG